MKNIIYNNSIVGIIHRIEEWKDGLDFLTPNESFIQAGTWWYAAGKQLKAHRHIVNKRTVERTHETVIVLSGSMRIDFYDDANKIFHQEIVSAGDICVILTVGHGYEILENNTKIVEVKNGPFTTVEKDKALI